MNNISRLLPADITLEIINKGTEFENTKIPLLVYINYSCIYLFFGPSSNFTGKIPG